LSFLNKQKSSLPAVFTVPTLGPFRFDDNSFPLPKVSDFVE